MLLVYRLANSSKSVLGSFTLDRIHGAVADSAATATTAMVAGLNGLEAHGKNGNLLTSYFKMSSNKLEDAWGRRH
jgi:2,4-dienoyl-CoA reductase-like NADH-dependent reductase (Old Yellow Enzyme family)